MGVQLEVVRSLHQVRGHQVGKEESTQQICSREGLRRGHGHTRLVIPPSRPTGTSRERRHMKVAITQELRSEASQTAGSSSCLSEVSLCLFTITRIS